MASDAETGRRGRAVRELAAGHQPHRAAEAVGLVEDSFEDGEAAERQGRLGAALHAPAAPPHEDGDSRVDRQGYSAEASGPAERALITAAAYPAP